MFRKSIKVHRYGIYWNAEVPDGNTMAETYIYREFVKSLSDFSVN